MKVKLVKENLDEWFGINKTKQYSTPEYTDPFKKESEIGNQIVDILIQMGFDEKNTYLSGLGNNSIGIEIERAEYNFAINKDGSIQLKYMEGFNAVSGQPTKQKINQNIGKIGSPEFEKNLESILI